MTKPGRTEPQRLREEKDPDHGSLEPAIPNTASSLLAQRRERKGKKKREAEERERGLGEREKSKVIRRKERFQSAFGHSKRNQFKSDYEKQRDVLLRQRGDSWNFTQVGLGKVLEQGPRLSSGPQATPRLFQLPALLLPPPNSSPAPSPLSPQRSARKDTWGLRITHVCPHTQLRAAASWPSPNPKSSLPAVRI